MEQLKMYYLPATPLRRDPLPAGLSISRFDGSERDLHAWADCLRNGDLIEGRTDEKAFADDIGDFEEVKELEDVFFLDLDGEHVATATGFLYPEKNVGDIHMVGVRQDCRGRGYAKYVLQAAVAHLLEKRPRFIRLTTDEPRKAAIKSYLSLGFLPVEYDYRMVSRWRAVLKDLGVEKTEMLYEDGTFYRTLTVEPDPPVRVGVLGAGRGLSIMDYCEHSDNAVLVAVCDADESCLADVREKYPDVALYTDYDAFLDHGLDLAVLANYANEHAPFAIKALEKGVHVLSELLPVQNMAEAVALVEAVESSGRLYMYGENCCFMPAPYQMAKLFRSGKMGAFQYGEGEYLHNCEPDWCFHSHGQRDHWRNRMTAFYYCTHSLGPLVHIAGSRPVTVTGFEAPYNAKMARMGALGAPFGVEMVTLENGAILKSLHGVGSVKNSLWFSVQGERGVMESARDLTKDGGVGRLYMNADRAEGSDAGDYRDPDLTDGLTELAEGAGHGGGDYYLLYNVMEAVRGNKQAEVIDVYEALDMFLPGLFAYFSVLDGGRPQAIPDLRNKAARERWRHDTRCTDPKAAGENLLPVSSKGDIEIPDAVFENLRQERAHRLTLRKTAVTERVFRRDFGGRTLSGIVTVPRDFDETADPLPVIVFLHGIGERGDGDRDLQNVKVHGIPKLFASDPEYQGLRAVTVSPQCPADTMWVNLADELMAYIDAAVKAFRGDPARVALTGLSMGGFGTWALMGKFPEKFCRAAPICGGVRGAWTAPAALRHKPIRVFHAVDDPTVPIELDTPAVKQALAAGADVSFTAYCGLGHNCWTTAYEKTELVEWLVKG